MTFEVRAIITDEIIGMDKAPVVRLWIKRASSVDSVKETKEEERAFLIPKQYPLTEDNPLFLLGCAMDQARKQDKLSAEVERGNKAAARKAAKKTEEKKDESISVG